MNPLIPSSYKRSITLRIHDETSRKTSVTASFLPVSQGILIGTSSSSSVFPYPFQDPNVEKAHGTLDCTLKFGIWIYMDHSKNGTVFNQRRILNHEAVILSHGDRLKVGNTELEVILDDDDELINHPRNNNSEMYPQASVFGQKQNVFHFGSPPKKEQQMNSNNAQNLMTKHRLPYIVTSDEVVDPFMTKHPEYIESPVAVNNFRRKSKPHLGQVLVVPAPPSSRNPHHAHIHGRSLRQDTLRSPLDTLSSTEPEEDDHEMMMTSPPPPLEYSSSPVSTSSFLKHRPSSQLANVNTQQQTNPALHLPTRTLTPQAQNQTRFFSSSRPTSTTTTKRDDLRIQVSKKMAGFAPASQRGGPNMPPSSGVSEIAGSPSSSGSSSGSGSMTMGSTSVATTTIRPITIGVGRNHHSKPDGNQRMRTLDFSPPGSPVAHKDILKQQQSLLSIIKNKYKEEQLLQQQQEEWLRTTRAKSEATIINTDVGSDSNHTTPLTASPSTGSSSTVETSPSPQRFSSSFINSSSSGIVMGMSSSMDTGKKSTAMPLTAHNLASATAVWSQQEEEKEERSRRHKRLVEGGSALFRQSLDAFSSVASSASTEIACYRRITFTPPPGSPCCDVDQDNAKGQEEFDGYMMEEEETSDLFQYAMRGSESAAALSFEDHEMIRRGRLNSSADQCLLFSFASSGEEHEEEEEEAEEAEGNSTTQ